MFDIYNPNLLFGILTVVGAGGASWGAAKHSLNGTRNRIKRVEESFDKHKTDTVDRLARVETKIDILLENR